MPYRHTGRFRNAHPMVECNNQDMFPCVPVWYDARKGEGLHDRVTEVPEKRWITQQVLADATGMDRAPIIRLKTERAICPWKTLPFWRGISTYPLLAWE